MAIDFWDDLKEKMILEALDSFESNQASLKEETAVLIGLEKLGATPTSLKEQITTLIELKKLESTKASLKEETAILTELEKLETTSASSKEQAAIFTKLGKFGFTQASLKEDLLHRKKVSNALEEFEDPYVLALFFKLRNAISTLNIAYHGASKSLVSNECYDTLLGAYQDFLNQIPSYLVLDKVEKIGAKPSVALSKMPHQTPMLSMSNCFDEEGLDAFLTRIKKEIYYPDHVALLIDFECLDSPHSLKLVRQGKHGSKDIELEKLAPFLKEPLTLPEALKPYLPLTIWARALREEGSQNKEKIAIEKAIFLKNPPSVCFSLECFEVQSKALSDEKSREEVFFALKEHGMSLHPKRGLVLSCEPKIDGIAVSLIYKKGLLSEALTRGDGKVGEVITQTIDLASVPKKLKGDKIPDYLEVRGEAYMNREDLESLNLVLIQKGEEPYANPRNATSGILRRIKPLDSKLVKLYFGAYDALGWNRDERMAPTHYESLLKLQSFGLTPVLAKLTSDLNQTVLCYESWLQKREETPYDMDGMVVKLSSYEEQESIGYLENSPRWAIAYKFPYNKAPSRLLEVDWQMGRTGVLTPVAKIERTALDGVVIQNITLNNHDYIERHDVHLGDTLWIQRAGGVIPQILGVDLEKRTQDVQKIEIPILCPSCQSVLQRSEKRLVCLQESCDKKLLSRLVYFVSRKGMEISGLGTQTLKQLFDAQIIRYPFELYELNQEKLFNLIEKEVLQGFAEKKVSALLNGLEESKTRPLPKLIVALGIPNIGEVEAKALAEKFRSLSSLQEAYKEPLKEEFSVAEESLVAYFKDEKNQQQIQELQRHGLLTTYEVERKNHQILANKRVVLTGTLSRPRKEVKSWLESFGAKVSSQVSKNTHFLLKGENAGQKEKDAEDNNVTIMNELEFQKWVEEQTKNNGHPAGF